MMKIFTTEAQRHREDEEGKDPRVAALLALPSTCIGMWGL
jgi:hypothetical protein